MKKKGEDDIYTSNNGVRLEKKKKKKIKKEVVCRQGCVYAQNVWLVEKDNRC
jgi:hypothetical protein